MHSLEFLKTNLDSLSCSSSVADGDDTFHPTESFVIIPLLAPSLSLVRNASKGCAFFELGFHDKLVSAKASMDYRKERGSLTKGPFLIYRTII